MADNWYHAENGLPILHEGGDYRVLGCLPPSLTVALPLYSWSQPVLLRSQWRDISLRHYGAPVLDQGQSSACGGFATEGAFTVAWYATGQPKIRFSPWWIYGLANHGRDNGIILGDALTALEQYGLCQAHLIPEGAMFRSQFPQAAFVDAAHHKVRAWALRSFDELCSALARGLVCVSGILVGRNFGKLDSAGVAPLPDIVMGGHALAHIGLRDNGGRWEIETLNSWTPSWGQGGYCWLHEGHYRGQVDAFAIATGWDDETETETDPPPVTGA